VFHDTERFHIVEHYQAFHREPKASARQPVDESHAISRPHLPLSADPPPTLSPTSVESPADRLTSS
jgi:hypothetical protein